MSDPESKKYVLGMIGLGTMGRNLMLNMADHGFAVAGYDTDPQKAKQLEEEGKDKPVKGFASLNDFLGSLKSPRAIMMLVPAGKIVDSVIAELLPLVEQGDIIIDAGNSHFTDTDRRVKELEDKGYHFFGMGISGGEKGARNGPSMMPGGDREAYKVVQPIFEAIAAKVEGEPCVTYIGPGSAGHFVKMVHNGIEYAIMELIAETYQLMKKGIELEDEAMQKVFQRWDEGRMKSYLLEITADIFAYKAPGADHLLLDDIKDEAKALGTGKWTSQAAMDLALPTTVIDTAVAIRDLSKYKSLREALDDLYSKPSAALQDGDATAFIDKMENAFYYSTIVAYAQGMHLLYKASRAFHYDLKLDEIAKIWRGGCIIRSRFLDIIFNAFHSDKDLEHLFLDKQVQSLLEETVSDTREVTARSLSSGLGSPAYAAALTYFDLLRSGHVPANLIQAQRDYFGAHTYELIGKEGTFHTEWEGN
jgi:6-phosphogluconate dehydrogenase